MLVLLHQLLALKLKGHTLTEYEAQLLEAASRLFTTRCNIRNTLLQSSLIQVERELDELKERSG